MATRSSSGDSESRDTHAPRDRGSIGQFVRTPRGRRWTELIAVTLVVVVVGGTVASQMRPMLTDVAGVPSPSGSATPSATAGPAASPPAGREPVAVARLEATTESGGIVPADASFRLTSLDGTPAADLAARVVVEPVVNLRVVPDAHAGSVRLVPATPLVSGAVYRFSLHGSDGNLLDSWAFQTNQGVRVVSTVPDNEQTDVPLDTGIEITFDQDGVAGAAEHVTFDPPLEGRFEQHGRVLAFVPKKLAPSTAYTVSISSGITVPQTGEASTAGLTFRFETAAKTSQLAGWLQPQDDLIESATADRPMIAFWVMREDESYQPPKRLAVDVYRLPNIDAAVAAFETARSWGWLRHAESGLTPTTGLTRVVSAKVPLEPQGDAVWAALPAPLPTGWYLVQTDKGRRPAQAILQVTNLSAYLAVSDTQTAVWANDVASGAAISGATVSTEGRALGSTDAHGLLLADTPARLLPAGREDCRIDCDPVLTVAASDGRAAILPATGQLGPSGYFDPYGWYSDASPRYWAVFNTDRRLFRPTDTINAWGMLRDRDTGDVPDAVLVRLSPTGGDEADSPAIASIEVKPRTSGVYAASIPIAALPIGEYSLQVLADGVVVSGSTVQVGQILKPAYRLDVATGHHVYIAGDRMRVTVKASFYDGTPAPGVPVRVSTETLNRTVTTDAVGAGVIQTTARVGEYNEGDPERYEVPAWAGRPEEGEIYGASDQLMVFPSSRTIDGTAAISGGRVRVSGTVNLVDQDRLEREIKGGASVYDVDPRGNAVARTRVTVQFTERVPVRGEAHQEYDFVQKKVITTYEYEVQERDAGTQTVRTDGKGRFTASIPAGNGDHDFTIRLRVADPDGHTARRTLYASRVVWSPDERRSATLEPTDPAERNGSDRAVGDPIDLTFHGPTPGPRVERYLFLEAQRGLRSATVQDTARFVTPFTAADAPNITVYGIRFNGAGYEATGFPVSFRATDRSLDVRLSTPAKHLKPGDEVTVDVAVRDAAGRPAAGTVVVRVIDEKLYTIAAAEDIDVLRQLYASVSTGVRMTYATHRYPQEETSGGDTGGGGDDRVDFEDSLLFKVIETDAAGHGSVSFKLSDDLTSWRVSAAALTADLQAGGGTLQLPVGLPFFAEATVAPEYLTGDRPTILVRTFGTGLHAGDRVTVTADVPSLGFASGPLRGTAFGSVAIPLPKLSAGRHEITIRARVGSGSSALSDGVVRTFTVANSRLTRSAAAQVDVTSVTHLKGGSEGLTTVLVSDAGASRSMQLLLELADGRGERLDSALAAEVARSLLVDHMGVRPDAVPATDFAADPYQTPDGGLALLPYASSDLELSALAAVAGSRHVNEDRLGSYLRSVYDKDKETRERRMIALAGLAALGQPVLPEIRAASSDRQLTIRERLWVGIGAARAGDAQTARAVVDGAIASHGEAVDGRIRLRVDDSTDDMAAATALAAVLAASVGDDRSTGLWAYVAANPPTNAVVDLQAVAYAAATLDWLKMEPARFAWSLGEERTTVDLRPGATAAFSLTPAQIADFTVERLEGSIGVTTGWREAVSPAALRPDPDVTISRRMDPAAGLTSSDLVTVRLLVSFKPGAAKTCYEVTDHVASGLVPVGNISAWVDPATEEPKLPYLLPYVQTDQIVRWCAQPDKKTRVVELRYYARVITPGRYAWEPSMVDSATASGRASLTHATTIEIRQ